MKLQNIGRGACGTVWACETGPAYKREDGNPARFLRNDFEIHKRVLEARKTLMELRKSNQIQIQIPSCHKFIDGEDKEWWAANRERFPYAQGYVSCNMVEVERIPSFEESTRKLLIRKFCARGLRRKINQNEPDRDCLVRPYLGRRRIHTRDSETLSQFKAFSLRNYPLHEDQMEELGIPVEDRRRYAQIMAETLALMHWIAGVDANDIEFVLAPCTDNENGQIENVLGTHSVWMLDFDLCRDMTKDEDGIGKAVKAFWRNDPFYPRPGNPLWDTFREQYKRTSEECLEICPVEERQKQRSLFNSFIERVEAWNNAV